MGPFRQTIGAFPFPPHPPEERPGIGLFVGVDHVGIGSDMGGASKYLYSDYRDFPLLLKLLRERGFSPEAIGKIAGGNYVRVFNRSTASG